MTLPRRFKPHCAALLASLALAFGAAGNAQAQSLRELYEAARTYDATYLAVRAQADAAVFRAEQAKALERPNVVMDGTVGRALNDTPYSSTASSNNVSSGSVTVTGRQSLYNPANAATIAQSERAVIVAESQVRSAEQDLIVRLAQAYFDVLGAADNLSTVQASKKFISEQLASAKRNFEVGTATITDTREAQARYDLVLAQEIAAENDLRVKRLALDQTVGRAGTRPLPLAVPVVLPSLMPEQVEAWVNNADASSPSVSQARLALDVARLETEKARAGNLPTVGMSASYGKTRNSIAIGNGAGSSTFKGTVTDANIGIAVNVPLFAGFSVQNRVRETLSLEDKAISDLDFARRAVAQGTRQAFFGVQSGQAQVKALEAAESSSKLALEATQLGYKVGVRVNVDVLNAQTQLFQTQRDLAKARYDVIVGGLRLRQASGQLTPDDISTVNQLLAP